MDEDAFWEEFAWAAMNTLPCLRGLVFVRRPVFVGDGIPTCNLGDELRGGTGASIEVDHDKLFLAPRHLCVSAKISEPKVLDAGVGQHSAFLRC